MTLTTWTAFKKIPAFRFAALSASCWSLHTHIFLHMTELDWTGQMWTIKMPSLIFAKKEPNRCKQQGFKMARPTHGQVIANYYHFVLLFFSINCASLKSQIKKKGKKSGPAAEYIQHFPGIANTVCGADSLYCLCGSLSAWRTIQLDFTDMLHNWTINRFILKNLTELHMKFLNRLTQPRRHHTDSTN